jgi:hypothetical protein
MTNPHRPPSAAIRNAITTALAGGNGVMAKWMLQYRGLPRGAADSVPELIERIVGYVAAGRLSESDVFNMAREIREYSAKHVYLLQGDAARMADVRWDRAEAYVDDLSVARIRVLPANPVRNYTSVADGHARICFSERHRSPRLVREANGWGAVVEDIPKTILIDADLTSGTVLLAMDPPGRSNPHGDKAVEYVEYYHSVARAILQTDLDPLAWSAKLAVLQSDRFRDRVTFGSQLAQDNQGLDMRYSCGAADLRDYATFQRSAPTITLRRSVLAAWQAPEPAATHAQLVAGESIARTVRTEIQASPAMVKFAQHTLREEMTYVLEQIDGVV